MIPQWYGLLQTLPSPESRFFQRGPGLCLVVGIDVDDESGLSLEPDTGLVHV